MQSTASTARHQLRQLDDQIRRCLEEIAETAGSTDETRHAEQDLALGSLTMRRLVTLQWL